MFEAYCELHALGHAHSIEVYDSADQLVGGIYGVAMGRVFFGESMFSVERDASKVAMARLVEECRARDIQVIDCQVASAHLARLGARDVSRSQFAALLRQYARRTPVGKWLRDP